MHSSGFFLIITLCACVCTVEKLYMKIRMKRIVKDPWIVHLYHVSMVYIA
jgi:hypothetical protein